MTPNIWIPLVIGLGAPIITLLLGYKKLSGRIGTSEAAQLWDESRGIRDDYRKQIAAMREVMDRLQDRVDKLETRNQQLHLENGRLGRMIDQHEETIAELRNQIHRLSDENDELKNQNIGLRQRVSELEPA